MRVTLLETPQTKTDWDRWSLAHKFDHDIIRQAILAQGGPNLTQYQLDPIALDQPLQFLENNQASHTDMNAAIGAQGSDLQDVDLTDQRQLQAWVNLHYLEHFTAGQRLKV